MDEYITFSVGVAAFVDTFIPTGYFSYGGAISTAAVTSFAKGASKLDVFLFASVGCVLAEVANFLASSHSSIRTKVKQLSERQVSDGHSWFTKYLALLLKIRHNSTDHFFLSFFKLVAMRFIPLTRPINSITFFSTHGSSTSGWIGVVLSCISWVFFWTHMSEWIARLLGF